MAQSILMDDNLAEASTKTFTKIYNLSNRKLNNTEITVLLMGLKFTPTPVKGNFSETEKDVNDFCRKLRLKEYFEGNDNTDASLVRNKSFFTPETGRNKTLDTYISLTKEMTNSIPKENKHIKHNLTQEQRNAIKSLADDTSIIIKEADKGGGIVLMNTDFYKRKILEMLVDESHYSHILDNCRKETFHKIRNLIGANGNLTNKEIDFLLNFDCKTSTFYGLPKIHKSETIEKACKENENVEYIEVKDPQDLTFRPIVAGPNCETSHLSLLLDILLKPFLDASATIRGKFLSHLFSEVFCQSCTLGFVPLFPKSVGHTVSENIYLFIILCHRIPLYPKHYFIFKNHENLRKGS